MTDRCSIVIRMLVPDEIQDAIEFTRVIQQHETGQYVSFTMTQMFFESLRQTDFVLGAFNHNKLIGTLIGQYTDTPTESFFLQNFAVHPDYRGKGVGSRLFESALALVDTQIAQGLACLEVSKDNRAVVPFYEYFGFQELPVPSSDDLLLVKPPYRSDFEPAYMNALRPL